LGLRAFLVARVAVGVSRLDPLLSLALQHLELLLVVQLPLELLLRRAEVRQAQPERVTARRVPLAHRGRELVLDSRDQSHPGIPVMRPPRTCQCKWKIVWPPP